MGDFIVTNLSSLNIKAWEKLYNRTEKLVWGGTPIGFLEEFVGFLKIPFSRRFRILDAGTGEGRNLELLLSTGANVTACDASEKGLHKATTLRGLTGAIPCIRCDLSHMPFTAAVFDFVLLADVVETLPNIDEVLKEIYRVLKLKGVLLCNIPGSEDKIFGDDMAPLGKNRFLYREEFYYQFFNIVEAVDLMERNGFAVLRNELRSWEEEAHPAFRGYRHIHTSRIFLATKT